jgi:DNA replication initiation complex subunit (GINS family)
VEPSLDFPSKTFLNIFSLINLAGGSMTDNKSDKEKEINLTYETLFEMVRREKNKAELQKMQDAFFSDFVNYLRQKKDILKGQESRDLYSEQERQKTQTQVHNIRKLVKELYDRREKKIIDMAIVKARTGSRIVDLNLYSDENALFNEITNVLFKYRSSILLRLMEGNAPETKDLKSGAIDSNNEKIGQNTDFSANEGQKHKNSTLKVEFLSSVPEFVGLDLEDYGPFNENDVIELPEQIASVLVENKVAKIVG